jgi:hypothetical protein
MLFCFLLVMDGPLDVSMVAVNNRRVGGVTTGGLISADMQIPHEDASSSCPAASCREPRNSYQSTEQKDNPSMLGETTLGNELTYRLPRRHK